MIAFPADEEWRVDGDEEEEGPAGEGVEGGLGHDVRGHPSVAPALGDMLKESICGCKGESPGGIPAVVSVGLAMFLGPI